MLMTAYEVWVVRQKWSDDETAQVKQLFGGGEDWGGVALEKLKMMVGVDQAWEIPYMKTSLSVLYL